MAILVLPDVDPSHPLQTSMDTAALARRAEAPAFPWREPSEPEAKTIEQVREFLRRDGPARSAAAQ
jgi:hypothetical protein